MSLALRLPNAKFTNNVGRLPPKIIDDATAFLLPGGDATQSLINWAPGGSLPATLVGTPTYEPGCAVLTEAVGFEVAMSTPASPVTQVLVGTNNTAGTSALGLMGNWISGSGATIRNLIYSQNANANVSALINGNRRAEVGRPGDPADFRMMVLRDDGSTIRIDISDQGVLTSVSGAYSGSTGVVPLRVGGTGIGSGEFRAAAALSWPSSLSDTDLDAVLVYLPPLLARRGVTVV